MRVARPVRAMHALGLAYRAILQANGEDELLQAVCLALVESGAYTQAGIWYTDEGEPPSLHPMAQAGSQPDQVVSASRDGQLAIEAIRCGRPLVALPGGAGAVAECVFPLLVWGETLLGCLVLYSPEAGVFDQTETELLGDVADSLATRIQALRAHAVLAHKSDHLLLVQRALRTLSAGNRVLLRAQDEAQLLSEMCRSIVEVGGYCLAWVGYAIDDEEQSIRPMAIYGEHRDMLDGLRLTWGDNAYGQTPSGQAIRSGQASVRRHIATDPGLYFYREEAVRRGFAAISGFPLVVDGKPIGCLTIFAGEEAAFEDRELSVLGEMAEDLAFGIATARAREKHAEAERTIERMAYYDSLTELPNRASLKARLSEAIEAARQQHCSLALLMLNIDRFREINEVLGYHEGDNILIETAQRLQTLLGPGCMLARLAVDEFAVLMPMADAEQAMDMARQMAATFSEPFEPAGVRVEIRVSIGIALYPGHGEEPSQLILHADAAMYQAKRQRSDIALYSGSPESDNRRRLLLIAELRRAIEDNQLLLYCQPKADMRSGRICGAEALVRWQHPEHGLIPPDQFIPLAEQTGLINPLTYWVLNAAMRQCYDWRGAGLDIPLAVNLSARNLQDPRLLDRIAGLSATWGASPDSLQFELTESTLMDDPEGALDILQRIKQMGFRLYVDDYGTGYSSLSYLKRLPIDSLKIDKSFVMSMPEERDSYAIVRSTIEMSHNLNLEVVAEGAASQQIWAQLTALGADVGQGSYLSNPMPAEQFLGWHGGH